MKSFLLLATLSLSTTTFASSQLCSFDDIQTLQTAQGPQSARVSEFLSLESPNFRCTLSVEHFVFPEACGGPRTFMSISKKNTELATIEQLAERSVELESAFNSTYGVVSDCLATMPPAAYCQAKVCT